MKNANNKALENLNKLVSQLNKQGVPKELEEAELTIWFNEISSGLFDNCNDDGTSWQYNKERGEIEKHLCCCGCGNEGFVSEEDFEAFDYDKQLCKECYSRD